MNNPTTQRTSQKPCLWLILNEGAHFDVNNVHAKMQQGVESARDLLRFLYVSLSLSYGFRVA